MTATKPEAQATGVEGIKRYTHELVGDHMHWQIRAHEAPHGEWCKFSDVWQRFALSAPASPAAQQPAFNANDLDFEPDDQHTVADMANVGRSLMREIANNMPTYAWNESPAEIVCDLINERDEALAQQPAVVGDAARDALLTIDLAVEVLEDRQRPAMAEDLEGARRVLAAALTPAQQEDFGGGEQ